MKLKERIEKHKFNILYNVVYDYFVEFNNNGIKLPPFIIENNAKKQTIAAIIDLYKDKEKYNEMYERAYLIWSREDAKNE